MNRPRLSAPSSAKAIRPAGPADERGAVLPLVVLSLVALITCVALAVDIGSLAATNRRLQKVADLAAIAGAEKLTGGLCTDTYLLAGETGVGTSQTDHVKAAAVASAADNSFVPGPPKVLTVEMGVLVANPGAPGSQGTFTAVPDTCAVHPTAVRVTATDRTAYSFGQVVGQGAHTSSRSAVGVDRNGGDGDRGAKAGYEMGSTVATLSSSSSPLLSSILGSMFCGSSPPAGCSVGIGLVGYQGLAAANVDLGLLASNLGLGSPTDLATANVTLGQYLTAGAKALGCTGSPPTMSCPTLAGVQVATLAGTVGLSAVGTTMVNVGKILAVAQGGSSAASGSIDALGFVTGSAQVVNGTNTVSIPNIGITVPGVTSTSMSLKLIEGPVTYIGPTGVASTTTQVDVTLTPNLNISVPLVATLTGNLPVKLTGGGAVGQISTITCTPGSQGMTLAVTTQAANAAVGGPGLLTLGLLPILPLGSTTTVTATATGAYVVPAASSSVPFAYPSEFLTVTKHVGGSAVGLGGTAVNVTPTVVGVSVPASVPAAVSTVLGSLDSTVLTPILRALGVNVGAADLRFISPPVCPPSPGLAG